MVLADGDKLALFQVTQANLPLNTFSKCSPKVSLKVSKFSIALVLHSRAIFYNHYVHYKMAVGVLLVHSTVRIPLSIVVYLVYSKDQLLE